MEVKRCEFGESGTKMGALDGVSRAEIDTSAPFESVKEAVTRFGGIGYWKPSQHKFIPGTENGIEEVDIAKLEEQTAQLEKDLIVKERETLDVLKELEATKETVKELKSKLLQQQASEVNVTLEMNTDVNNVTSAAKEAEKENHQGGHPYLAGCLSPRPSSAPGLILMELKQAKLNLCRTTNDLTDIQGSVESLNKKLEKERISLEKTRQRISQNSSKISSLEEELNQTWLKLQVAKYAETKSSADDPLDMSKELQRLSSKAEQFKKVGEAARCEVSRAISEIEQTRTRIKTTEMRLLAAKKMKEAARAAEAVALRDSQQMYSQTSYGHESPSYAPQYGYASPHYYPPSQQEPQDYAPSQQEPQYYPPSQQEPQYYPPSQHHGSNKRILQRRYSRIADNYNSLDQVTEALANAGLESSNLIVGIDFTKSNEWTGKRSFNRKSLHHIGDGLNPYEQAISIIGKTLAVFDEDNLIPCFGFGDASTHDQDVFSFYPDGRFCNGFEEVLSRYREIMPHLRLAGPTSFAPIIEMAMTIVEQSRGQYHVLVIIADGQVTKSVDTQHGQLSPQEQKTVDAIVQASKLPLSIILVGVGDGPWDMMKDFDDNIPARAFDNFQFVNFTEIMSKNVAPSRKETEFALAALMEIPSQYKATIELNILGGRKGNIPERVPLPPPTPYRYGAASFNSSKPAYSTGFQYGNSASLSSSKPYHPTSFGPSVPPYPEETKPVSSASPAPSSTYESQLCPICLSNSRDMAFGCGHQTCEECSKDLETCPICRSPIQTRIKLYF